MNRTLLRQLKRLYLNVDKPPQNLEEWTAFVKIISETYEQNAEDRYLLERSLEISSREMSERMQKNKDLNLQLMQASKLVSLGTLASGIAHELNNPLQGIKGYIELLTRAELDRSTALSHLDRISRLTNRMVATIKHLLKLSRKSIDQPKTKLLITEPIQEAYELLGKQLLYDQIQFKMTVLCESPFVLGDLNQLFGIFQNLLANSRDAFNTVKEKRPFRIDINIDEVGEHIVVLFKDNAGGIPPEILPRIFDPFFTTKDVGSGTGLGLALSRQSIEEIGGTIQVKVEGNDSIFTLSFPKASAHVSTSSSGSIGGFGVPDVRTAQAHYLSALIVDDEIDICNLLELHFSEVMRVTICNSGLDAIEKLKDSKFDLLITDFRLPNISGAEVATFAKEKNPEIKIVVISGHLGKDLPKEFDQLQPFLFVEKPFESVAGFYSQVAEFTKSTVKKAA
jgi:signal transduction histidine kinase